MATTESIVIQPAADIESPEYIAEMAKKGEAAVNGGVAPEVPEEIAPKPEGIPDKFYNAETGVVDYQALAKSYVELEKTKGKPVEPPKTPEVKTEVTPKTPEEEAANKVVTEAGLDMNSLSQEYAKDGSLADASYEKLAKAGIPKDIVDAFIDGQMAKVQVARSEAHSITDGETGYNAMVSYAQANLSPEEISAYNNAVNSKDSKVRDLAVRGMWSRYNSESGTSGGDLITGKTNSKIGDGAYQSRAEMMVDMNSPKYKTDPAFRAKVSTKLANSDIF